jgi:hypothetical protein
MRFEGKTGREEEDVGSLGLLAAQPPWSFEAYFALELFAASLTGQFIRHSSMPR